MSNEWTEEEVEFLKEKAGSRTIPDLARQLGRKSPEVSTKLVEMGLQGSDSRDRRQLYEDDLVDAYGKALKQVQQGKYAPAIKTFEKIVADSDLPELIERARQMLVICGNQTGDAKGEEGSDPFLNAVWEKNRGNLAEAMKICKTGDRLKKDERFLFLAASIHSLEERYDDAADALGKAMEMNPKNRVYAFHDPDFEGLRQHSEHSEIFDVASA